MSKYTQANRRATLHADQPWHPPDPMELDIEIIPDDNPVLYWGTLDPEPLEIGINWRMNGGTWSSEIRIGGNNYQWPDTTLLCGDGNTFEYRVRSHFTEGSTEWSNLVEVEAYSSP